MIKTETYSILEKLKVMYNGFKVDQSVIDLWHEYLKYFSLEVVEKRLFEIGKSPYTPSLSEFVAPLHSYSTIPDVIETMRLIHKEQPVASKEVRDRELARMRKVLGIKKEVI